MIRYTQSGGAVTFEVRVVPRASRSALAGEHDGALRVRVAAAPVEGAANEELVRFLARVLGIPVRAVEIIGGHTSKSKRVRAAGVTAESLQRLAEGK